MGGNGTLMMGNDGFSDGGAINGGKLMGGGLAITTGLGIGAMIVVVVQADNKTLNNTAEIIAFTNTHSHPFCRSILPARAAIWLS